MNSEAAKRAVNPASPEQVFFAALRQGTPMIQCCETCRKRFFFPRTHCPTCDAEHYAWVPMTRTGTLYSFSEIPGYGESAGRNVVLIDMDDGFRMMSTVPGAAPGALAIGMRLRAIVDPSTEPPRLVLEETSE
ncbi:OB-fold domain-containing protein [Cupriavidus metallidurans]|uniref:Zn-ribbon domain-containing OB-fold protein n=1 Tax=Cupriavidus TaxID=106589 RepID=UPI000E9AA60F|nr:MULTISPECIES: OB-fold domain-containing protein [unclassified Cupriavidus]GMG93427.1 hypothetical protein Cmtc_46470 [Cupriavidus sp. TKC]HBD35401.1 DNA-binding protein [Cupriavidus sp.]HBO82675.1 DNA-binding protein [Cupriavidus sp.]